MKATLFIVGFAAALAFASAGCTKERHEDMVSVSESEGHAKALWPRVRFRYNYEFINGCSGGECGSCVGICVFWPVKLGPAPGEEELRDGIGRAELSVEGNSVVLVPMDLPMDPGSGKVILDDDWEMDQDVASMLGFTSVTLMPGEYTVDYSKNDRFGRVVVPAVLVN